MGLEPVSSKLSGLRVLAPCSVQQQSQGQESNSDSDPVFSERMINQIYEMYREYISSFSPNMNQNQILLYIYKQFFNKKNCSFSNEFSQQLIKLLTNEIILRYMREKIQVLVEQDKNNCQ